MTYNLTIEELLQGFLENKEPDAPSRQKILSRLKVISRAITWLQQKFNNGQLFVKFQYGDDGTKILPTLRAAVERESGFISEGRVEITQGPWVTPDGRLVFRVNVVNPDNVEKPAFAPDELPLQLTLFSIDTGQMIHTFQLKGLSNQLLNAKLPDDIVEIWRRFKEATDFPFGFVLRPSQHKLLAATLEEVCDEQYREPCRVVYEIRRMDAGATQKWEAIWQPVVPNEERMGSMDGGWAF
jgi:hypothetical protein